MPAERDIKIVRPLYSVEVTETETAKFETEISEADVHGNWKLKGEALHQSAVSAALLTFICSETKSHTDMKLHIVSCCRITRSVLSGFVFIKLLSIHLAIYQCTS